MVCGVCVCMITTERNNFWPRYLAWVPSVLWRCWLGGRKGIRPVKKYGGWWRWALVSPDGVAPSRMIGVSASVNLPLHHKVQKFSSGTDSPGWSRKKAVNGCGVVWWCVSQVNMSKFKVTEENVLFSWKRTSETVKTWSRKVNENQTWTENCKKLTPAAAWSVLPRVFYAYVCVVYDLTFCLGVLCLLFCKHVRLSCVFFNKLT